ncbi:lytic transglycosylase domain-containing protein [Enterobacter roggenkampii]|uniref:lytic transglycosylase domain-containing protein n=1 Tax=Enterobacter roggenkampii TaxID=1812935 RepID=UPI001F42120F|nr:lytic transglycosylase domain-containing protein [Enterobacter roggenkampii]
MIINELAYKVTIKADEFLNGKKKVEEGVKELQDTVDKSFDDIDETSKQTGKVVVKTGDDIQRSTRKTGRVISDATFDVKKFGTSAATSFRGAYAAAAGFLGIGAGLYGIKQLFTSTSNEIVRASNQAKFFGTDVNKMFGLRRGFQQAGLNGDAFIGAAGSARMALANIADPTVFGGLTGAAQNLMVLGARTGLNINNLGDPSKALAEFSRYGKNHSQENLMQVMAAAGFDPTDAAKIKSGELKSLVDSETKKSNITAQQVKEQEALVVKMGELGAQVDRVAQGIAMAFTPAVIDALDSFGKWIEAHQGEIIGFFREAGDKIKAFTDAVGGAENALKILAGIYIGKNAVGLAGAAGLGGGKGVGGLLGKLGLLGAGVYFSGDIADATTPSSVKGLRDEDKPFIYQKHWLERLLGIDYEDENAGVASNPSGRTLADKNNNPGNIRGKSGVGGFAGYSSEQEGWDAMSSQLMRYFNGQTTGKRLKTVKDIISTWAPSSENDTSSYIKQVSSYLGVGANEELNLADPNVMAKLRTAMARHEGFGNWQNGLKLSGSNQYQNQYYLQQQSLANARMQNTAGNIDNSQSSKTVIDKVIVNTNPQTVDALTSSVKQQSQRAATSSAFSSAVQ